MKDLKTIFVIEAVFVGVTVAMAFIGNWGAFAGLAFMSLLMPLWIMALGVWANVIGVDGLNDLLEGKDREVGE